MLTSQDLDLEANMLSHIAASNPCSLSAVLMPQFSYKKGQLFLVEDMVRALLKERALNFDRKFALVFKEKHDKRDQRSLCYDGRAIPSRDSESGETPFQFQNCSLLQGYCGVAEQL